jgi:peptidoglycan/LPS O-acetylase OafA/YrhL
MTRSPIVPGQEILSVQMLRGIASFMVCLHHFTDHHDALFRTRFSFKPVGDWGGLGVEVFFIISGFIIPYSMYVKNYRFGDLLLYLKKRMIRIEPPYLLCIVLVLLLNYLSTLSPYYKGGEGPVDWVTIISLITYTSAFTHRPLLNGVFWTLAIEFHFYLLIAITYNLISSTRRILRLSFLGLFMLSFFTLPPGLNIYNYAPYFVIGILLFQFVCGIIKTNEFVLVLTLALAGLYYKLGIVQPMVSVATILVILYVRKVPRPLLYLGTISYSLYLLHSPVGGRIMNISANFVHDPLLYQGVVVLALAVSIGCAAIYYHFVEKYFKSLAGSIIYKKHE